MDRWPLIVSTLFFFGSFGWTMFALGAGKYRPSRLNLLLISSGFLFQTLFLFERGQAHGSCPLKNLFEMFIFLSWSVVLLYLLVGPAYRLTLLGAFTAPVVTLFQMFALMAPIDTPVRPPAGPPKPWLEMHAAISIIAYGAFALASVAGVMFIAQERQLKTHHIRSMFFYLPPISELASAIRRLISVGLLLLSIGLVSGFFVGNPGAKVAWGVLVWGVYGGILLVRHKVSARRMAWLAVIGFVVTLVSLYGINKIAFGP